MTNVRLAHGEKIIICQQMASQLDAKMRSMLSSDDDDSEIFICSISSEIMSDPVTTSDGQTYERSGYHWGGFSGEIRSVPLRV